MGAGGGGEEEASQPSQPQRAPRCEATPASGLGAPLQRKRGCGEGWAARGLGECGDGEPHLPVAPATPPGRAGTGPGQPAPRRLPPPMATGTLGHLGSRSALFLPRAGPSCWVQTLAVAAEATSRAARRRGLSRAISGMRAKAQDEGSSLFFISGNLPQAAAPQAGGKLLGAEARNQAYL